MLFHYPKGGARTSQLVCQPHIPGDAIVISFHGLTDLVR